MPQGGFWGSLGRVTDRDMERTQGTQGTLFDLPEDSARQAKPTAARAAEPRKGNEGSVSSRPVQIYEPHHIPYKDLLAHFNGDSSLALYWFSKQKMEE